jgi:hypothetical protein
MPPPTVPTGPAIVGLEPEVLPARVTVSRRLSGTTLVITAPRCRFGTVTYSLRLWSPGLFVQPLTSPRQFGLLPSGKRFTAEVPKSWPDWSLTLHLLDLKPDPRAFRALSPSELADALAHPLPAVREAALLALQHIP